MSDAEEPTLALSNITIAECEIIAYIVLAAFWFAVVYVVVYKGARMRSRRVKFAALADEMRETWDASDTIRDASERAAQMREGRTEMQSNHDELPQPSIRDKSSTDTAKEIA